MVKTYTGVLSASIFPILLGATNGGPPANSQHHASYLAYSMKKSLACLANAIRLAEKHCAGTVIGARVCMSPEPRSLASGMDRINTSIRSRRISPGLTQKPPETGRQKYSLCDMDMHDNEHSSDALYAIVTCVMGDSCVQDVMINLRTNVVAGVATVLFAVDDTRPGDVRYPKNHA